MRPDGGRRDIGTLGTICSVSAWFLPRCVGCKASKQSLPSTGLCNPQAVTGNFGEKLRPEMNLQGQAELALGRERYSQEVEMHEGRCGNRNLPTHDMKGKTRPCKESKWWEWRGWWVSAQLDKSGGQPRGLESPASRGRPVPGLPDAPGGVPGLLGHSWQSLSSCRLPSTCCVDGKQAQFRN